MNVLSAKKRKTGKVKANESLEVLYHSGAPSFRIADSLSCISKRTLAGQKCSPDTPAEAFGAAVPAGLWEGGARN